MKRMPFWMQGIFYSCVFILLIFFLKIICPLDVGCLADPFLVPLFSPLSVLSLFGIETLGTVEPFFILFFWMLCGAIVGTIVGLYKKNKKLSADNDKISEPTDDSETDHNTSSES